MTTRQIAQRLKNVLRSLRWGGTGEPVFPYESVIISVGMEEENFGRIILPAAIIRPVGGSRDPRHGQEARLWGQGFELVIMLSMAGDPEGEIALMGRGRGSSATSAAGRGLLEIEEEVLDAVALLNELDHMNVQLVASSDPAPAQNDVGPLVWKGYRFDATTSLTRSYPAPRFVAYAGGVLSWTAPEVTTDLVKYVVRRVAGTVPVARVTEGTNVALGSPLDTSIANAPGAGTWTYCVFAQYAKPGGTVAIYTSDYEDVTVEV